MLPRSTLRAAFFTAAMALCDAVVEAQIPDFISEERGIATGVLLSKRGGVRIGDGLPITIPFADYVADKTYTYQVVNPGSGESSESFAQLDPSNRDRGFGSALATATGVLEVGAFNRHSIPGADFALSRFNIHIKNSTDQDAYFVFEYAIPGGQVEIIDFSERFNTALAEVSARIDYTLLTPAGPFGGTYDETTGNLLDFRVSLTDELEKTDNAQVRQLGRSPIGPSLGYEILPFDGIATFPVIPARGELFLYYDMYALISTGSLDGVLGHAQLGDPTDLIQGRGVRLIAAAVPEPSSVAMLALGLAGLLASRVRLQRRSRWDRSRASA